MEKKRKLDATSSKFREELEERERAFKRAKKEENKEKYIFQN